MTKILIVEDDPYLSEMYVSKLSQSGFDVELASDGQTGMKMAQDIKPDLILLDIVLPKMDGFEILKTIKGDDELKNIPVILLTNLGQKSEVDKGLALGAEEYIIKAHFTPTAVLEKIKEVLSRKK